MNGGYILVDCKKLDLTKGSTPQTIDGIHERVKEAMKTGKQIRACNCVWGTGLNVTPIDVMAIDFTTEIICTASTLQIVITPADSVTIVNMAE